MNTSRLPNQKQPLSFSLASLRSAAAVVAALLAASPSARAQSTWDGNTLPTPGDGLLWTDPLNWSGDALPGGADVIFANALAGVGTIFLNGDQSANSLTFTESDTLGAYGTNNFLNNLSGAVTVTSGDFATINASYGGTNGIILSGGGTLFLNNPFPTYTGNITVDGVGTTLLHRQEGPGVQYNGINSAQEFGRFDQLTLGASTTVRTITLTNGGEYKIINTGNNPELNFKNIVIGSGGGTLNLGAGYILQNLDDLGQITATTEAFTKAGKGRLVITGTMAVNNPLAGIVNINGGMLSLDNITSQTVGANTYNRFTGIAALGTTLNINSGGTLMINSGTQSFSDVPIINANNGSIIAVNGQDHIFGYAVAAAASAASLNITGTSTLLTRDLFAPQTQRFPRFRTQLDGTGTLEIRGNTNAGGTPRVVIERNTPGSTFTGTFRLVENSSLEANPRFNASAAGGTGTVIDTGKVIADGDVEFAGWGGTLDVRDSNPAAASVLDYTTNEISVTTPQAGALNIIAPVRATAATGTGHLFNFGTLTMGNHRIAIGGNNSYQTGFGDTANIIGNAVIIMNSDNSPLVFSNAAAISEDAAGRSLTLIKAGGGTSAVRDVVVGGAISLSNLEISTGTLHLRGANGAITAGFGGAAPTITVNGGATFTNGLPTQGVLNLDGNGTSASVAGTATVFAAANNDNRIVDTASVNLRSNSILRLTSAASTGTSEAIGTVNISGHGGFDIVKTGTPPAPVVMTLNSLNLTASGATANFTGTSLGLVGADTSRILITGALSGFFGPSLHSANEWAKYDATIDGSTGVVLGVTPFTATDYTIGTAESTWAAGQQIKQTAAAITLTGSRTADRFAFQPTATSTVNLAGFVLTSAQGGILTSGSTSGIVDGATGATPSGTAGITTTAAQLFVHNNALLDIRTPVTGSIDFVKSGTGTLRLTHQGLGVGTGATAINPFTATPWASTLTGSWIVNDGRLEVHRGAFLGGRPVVMNGGHLEINEPVSNANADTIISGWGNNIIVNANATVAADDNGESADANTGDRASVLMGSLTINNGAIFTHGSFSDIDIAYMGGATFAGTPTLNAVRGGVNSATIINGALAGSGFNMVAFNANSASVVLGGGPADTTPNTYNGPITIYAGSLRPNKANGALAISDGAATEDVVINGGALFWGPGQHGDLATSNNVVVLNNSLASGIAPTSPAAIKLAGMNQIADTATITLLTGTLGESDRITNEKWGTLIQKNGTVNVGLGTMEVDTATISGGALGFDRGGTFKAGTLNFLPGAYDLNVFTGRPTAGAFTTAEIGAGGVSFTGQSITLGTAFSANVAGAGGRLRLGGNVTVVGSDLLGGSYGRKGIYVQTSSTFRELGASHIDLLGGTRDFNIDTDVIFTVTPRIINGGLTKSGNGALVLEPYERSTFAGPVIVNGGVLEAKGDAAFGTSAGGVTVNSGGTIKLDSSWTYGDDFTVSGPGSIIPGGGLAREVGALIAESGTNRLNGAFVLNGAATIAGNTFLDPSVAPGAGGAAYRIGTLLIAGPGGVTGTGTLSLSGHGDGIISNGVKTTSGGLTKDGAGRWTIAGASTYPGTTTIAAGLLRITDGAALGSSAAGTTIYAGAQLELAGGISSAEPLNLYGAGAIAQGGAVLNVSGTNTLTGAITLGGNATLHAASGTLALGAGASITGYPFTLTLAGAGNGTTAGALLVGGGIGSDALIKNGTGTWTINGGAGLAGATTVNGGSLNIASASSVLDSNSPLSVGSGTLTVSGAAQSPGALFIIGGGATINGGAGLTVGNIARNSGGTANFTGLVNAASSTNVNGILGAYATVGTNWARLNGSFNIVGFSGYVDLNSPLAAVSDNSALDSYSLLTAAPTRNSLKISAGSGMDLGINNLTLNSGGLMYSSSALGGIGGTGTIAGATSSDELIVNVNGSGALDITAPLIGSGSGGLTKSGNGKLVLSGNSNFSGSININGGTLSIVGPGGTTHPTALGTATGPRNLNINGGTFEVVGGDYDSGITNMYYVVGAGGGTVRSTLGSTITINDGAGAAPGQLSGSGDLTLTGGGRYNVSGGTPNFPNFTGRVTVNGGILNVGNGAVSGLAPLGVRPDQTITLKSGSAIMNQVTFGLGQVGLVNNIVAEGGVEFFSQGGNRVFAGDIQLSGTNTIALFERDATNQERQIYFNGRVSGTGITLNVFGSNFGNPFYLASGSNPISGTINLNANAVLEVRAPGSLGLNTGDVTVNLNGANSRLFLRHFQNGDFRANVVVNDTAEINSDRLVGFAGGGLQILSVNHLTFNGDNKILTIGGANTYHTRVGGTATFNAATNTILNVTASDLILENGLTFGTPGSTLDKRGGFTAILRGPTNHTGKLIIQGGLIHLQDNGTLAGTTSIDLRGGELRVDNSAVVNTDRINNAATISLGGGVLRLTGAETLGTVTASGGTTQVISNPTDETVANPLTLTGFTRAAGAVVQFQSPDVGAAALAVGQNTIAQTRVGSRIYIPGQVTTTQTIPGFLGNNNVDFVQYDGATIDSGAALGVRDMRNPGNVNSPANYTDNAAETAWSESVILHSTTASATVTLTASRALDAWKAEAITTLNQGAFDLRIKGGGILAVGQLTTINGNGRLYAGGTAAAPGVAELFIGGNNTLIVNSVISNNPLNGQSVALVKTGSAATLTLSGGAANTYTGGTYVTAGTLNVLTNNALGGAGNQITLSGGALQFNIPSTSTAVALGGLGQNINVLANSTIILDNGTGAGTDNDLAFGSITINGPYTLGLRSFDSMDATFTGTHTISGSPTFDMVQATTQGSGTGFFTINGPIAGTSGFFVTSSGNVDNTTSILQIGAGESAANTYTGKVTVLLTTFSEDLRVELNKAAGTNAITGDLEINGGIVRNVQPDQIADTSNMLINQGSYDAFGKNETIASVTMRGGNFRTNSPAATPINIVTVTGNFEITGADDLTGSADGVGVNSNSTLIVGGTLKMNGYAKGTVGAGAGSLIVGGLEMTGTTLTENASGTAMIRLNGNVTTFASSNVARLGNNTTSASLELNGTRTFNIADGPAGIDISVSTAVVDSTAPVAAGGFVKAGAGALQFEGAGNANNYTGPTSINEGTVVLFKNNGVNALGNGTATNTLAIGDGIGGSLADQLIVRNSNQIADTTSVTVASSGLLDLDTFNTSETIGDLSGAVASAITLGPISALIVDGPSNTTFSGSIGGGGSFSKQGAGALTLNGPLNAWTFNSNAGTLNFESNANNATVNVGTGAITNFRVAQKLTALNLASSSLAKVQAHAPAGPAGIIPIDTSALNITAGGVLDLTNNAMVVRGGSLATITAAIASGLYTGTNGYWDGPGINSSSAAADSNFLTGLGVLDNSLALYPDFGGVTGLTGAEILVKYTYYGDSDLSGTVTADDFSLFLTGFNDPLSTGWVFGDYDYSGSVTADDFSLFLNSFNNQGGPLRDPALAAELASFAGQIGAGGAGPASGQAVVPEPGSIGLLAAGAVGLLSRRRRSSRGTR